MTYLLQKRLITAPLAPRAGVDGGNADAGVFKGEDGVAGSDTGAAVDDNVIEGDIADGIVEAGGDRFGIKEFAIGAGELEMKEVPGAGNVAGDGIDGLGFAAEAGGGADVDDGPSWIKLDGFDKVAIDGGELPVFEGIGRSGLMLGGVGVEDEASGGEEFGLRVEHADLLMAGGAEHPPEAGSGVDATGHVIDNDLIFGLYTEGTEHAGEAGGRGERMAAAKSGIADDGEVVIENGEAGAGEVAAGERAGGVGASTGVQEDDVFEIGGEFFGGNDNGGHRGQGSTERLSKAAAWAV